MCWHGRGIARRNREEEWRRVKISTRQEKTLHKAGKRRHDVFEQLGFDLTTDQMLTDQP
jgi:hypothetical protein